MYALILATMLSGVVDTQVAYLEFQLDAPRGFQCIVKVDGHVIDINKPMPVSLLKTGEKRMVHITMTYVDNDGSDKTVRFKTEVEGGYVVKLPVLRVGGWHPCDVTL